MKRIAVWILLVVGTTAVSAESLVPEEEKYIAGEIQTRLFFPLGDWQPYTEIRYRQGNPDNTPNDSYASLFTGLYWQSIPWLRLGGFYRLETGNQHDDDWKKVSEASMDWEWKDAEARFENSAAGDISFRTVSDFLPGSFFERGLFELKNRAYYNFYHEETLWQLRPGFTWFWFHNGVPAMNFFVQYEAWFVNNARRNDLWEDWSYVGALYFLTEDTQIGSTLAYRRTFWETSTEFEDRRPGDSYQSVDSSIVVSLLLIHRFRLQ